MAWSTVSTVLSMTAYPITYLVYAGFGVLQILVTPLVWVGRYCVQLALLPLRILARLQALLIFVTVAGITGIALGLLLHYTTTFIVEMVSQWLEGFWTPSHKPKHNVPGLYPGEISKESNTLKLSGDHVKQRGRRYLGTRREGEPSASTMWEEEEEDSQDSEE
ncbi:uncharacterized protein ATNIH1004_010021 [Aspergillus tanneri]|uniref:Uncharacterized protein n=1 Tax=Aspergillus tanneri TaxID=1220188 RepID=A0A5M9MD88_9EURO|nr:uncharacterized protein ATNIH1004_010021 [Aspergillus tanneri]KAA8643254.1 hypothetical protein ATNIH1004_010021 [Aspergillus tanneri]